MHEKKETKTCNRPIHIAHYSHSHLGPCRKHFVIASKITISGIEAGFAVLYSFTWQFNAEKRATIIYNVFIKFQTKQRWISSTLSSIILSMSLQTTDWRCLTVSLSVLSDSFMTTAVRHGRHLGPLLIAATEQKWTEYVSSVQLCHGDVNRP